MHYLIKKSDKKILERSADLRFVEALYRIHNDSLPCYIVSCYSEVFPFRMERWDQSLTSRVIKKEDAPSPGSAS